jgi:hypothetical protein
MPGEPHQRASQTHGEPFRETGSGGKPPAALAAIVDVSPNPYFSVVLCTLNPK